MHPKVSVNICCYNSEKFIKETIQSVLDQTLKDFEVIIIDDGSKDRTGEIIGGFNDERIKYCYQENKGLSASRNKAIALSSGEYIALLDHDDLWEKEKLEMQIRLFESNPRLGLVFSDAYQIDECNKVLGNSFSIIKPFRGDVFKNLIRNNFIPCLTIVMRRQFLDKAGYFRENYYIAEEYDCLIRLSVISEFDFVNMPLGSYRLHAGNISKNIEIRHKEIMSIMHNLKEMTSDVECLKLIEKRIVETRIQLGCYYLEKGEGEKARHEFRSVLSAKRANVLAFMYLMISLMPDKYMLKITGVKNSIKDMLKRIINSLFL